MNKVKRQLKRIFNKENRKNENIPIQIFIFCFIFFIAIQLYINSSLSTQGAKLQSLNSEKNLLIEENRELEKDLANAKSITVVENLTNKKYKLTPTKISQLVYVTGNVTASR